MGNSGKTVSGNQSTQPTQNSENLNLSQKNNNSNNSHVSPTHLPSSTSDPIKLNQTEINSLNWTIFTSLDGIDAATANLYSDSKTNTINNNLGVIQASDTHKIL